MVSLAGVAVGGGAAYGAYRLTATPTTKLVVLTVIVAILYDGVFTPDDYDYGLGDLALNIAIAAGWTGIVRA